MKGGLRLEMFFRLKKGVLVIFLMCESNERVESRITPRFLTSAEVVVKLPEIDI